MPCPPLAPMPCPSFLSFLPFPKVPNGTAAKDEVTEKTEEGEEDTGTEQEERRMAERREILAR